MARISRRRCTSGKILRKSYSRKSYTRSDGTKVQGAKVPARCIKDLGKAGKGKRLFVLRKGTLSRYGYSTKISTEARHMALRKALENLPRATIVRKLNALAILNKNTHPSRSRILRADMKFVMKISK
jgi:hypothetical protein